VEKASWATLHLLDGHSEERPSLAQPTLEDAIELALNKPLWRLLAASRATHWWCMPNNDDDDVDLASADWSSLYDCTLSTGLVFQSSWHDHITLLPSALASCARSNNVQACHAGVQVYTWTRARLPGWCSTACHRTSYVHHRPRHWSYHWPRLSTINDWAFCIAVARTWNSSSSKVTSSDQKPPLSHKRRL